MADIYVGRLGGWVSYSDRGSDAYDRPAGGKAAAAEEEEQYSPIDGGFCRSIRLDRL